MAEILIGFLGGVLIGATGAGISLITPLLILVGYRPTVAVSTGLANLVLSKLTGATFHHRLGHWPKRNLWSVVAGGLLGVAVFAALTWRWTAGGSVQLDHWLKLVLAVVLLVAAAAIQFSSEPGKSHPLKALQDKPAILFVIGATVGMVVVATAAGSGTMLVPALLLTTEWQVPQLAAVSNIYGLTIGLLGFLVQLRFGFFNPHLFLLNLIGLIPGVVAGSLLSRHISRKWFVRGIGIASAVLGMSLLLRK
jgi:uncharacterized protein